MPKEISRKLKEAILARRLEKGRMSGKSSIFATGITITEGPPSEPEPVKVELEQTFDDANQLEIHIFVAKIFNYWTWELFYEELQDMFGFQ